MFKPLNPPVRKEFLGFGRVNVPATTISRMRDIIKESGHSNYVREWAKHIIEDVPDRDEVGEVQAIFDFLQLHSRYTKDPKGMEYVQTPLFVLSQIGLGQIASLDCDDYTVTSLSLLRSIGYPVKIRATGYSNNKNFSHVYGLVKIKGSWKVFDAVRKDEPLFWEAPGRTVTMDLEV